MDNQSSSDGKTMAKRAREDSANHDVLVTDDGGINRDTLTGYDVNQQVVDQIIFDAEQFLNNDLEARVRNVSFDNNAEPLIIVNGTENLRKKSTSAGSSRRDSSRGSITSKKQEKMWLTRRSYLKEFGINKSSSGRESLLSHVRNSLELLKIRQNSIQETPNTNDTDSDIGTNINSTQKILDADLSKNRSPTQNDSVTKNSNSAQKILDVDLSKYTNLALNDNVTNMKYAKEIFDLKKYIIESRDLEESIKDPNTAYKKDESININDYEISKHTGLSILKASDQTDETNVKHSVNADNPNTLSVPSTKPDQVTTPGVSDLPKPNSSDETPSTKETPMTKVTAFASNLPIQDTSRQCWNIIQTLSKKVQCTCPTSKEDIHSKNENNDVKTEESAITKVATHAVNLPIQETAHKCNIIKTLSENVQCNCSTKNINSKNGNEDVKKI